VATFLDAWRLGEELKVKVLKGIQVASFIWEEE
jgi:hypothetical protein